MRRRTVISAMLVCALSCLQTWAQALQSESGLTSENFKAQGVGGQTATAVAPEASGPRLVQFSGALKDSGGQPLTGVQGVTFALYKEQQGGAALWLETQNVTADEQGRYSVLLGSTQPDGLPLELFTSNEARWLGVQAIQSRDRDGAVLVEQPRVLLVSVPYALKAADAETLGGQPLSAFVLNDPSRESLPRAQSRGEGAGASARAVIASTSLLADKAGLPVAAFSTGIPTAAAPSGSGTANNIVKWLDGSGTLGDAMNIVEVGGNFGIGTTNPTQKLDVNGNAAIANSSFLYFRNSTGNVDAYIFEGPANNLNFNGGSGGYIYFNNNANNVTNMTIANAGSVGIGTMVPSFKLDVQGGQINASGGLCMAGDCKTGWASVGGSGDITAVNTAAGGGLTGGAASGDANLSLLTTCASGQLLKWNGSAWGCAADLDSGGDITAVTAGTGLIGGATTGDAPLALSPAARARAITYLAGCDTCDVLTDADDQNMIFFNVIGSLTIASVTCFSDAGSPTINLRREGSSASLLSSDLACSPIGATSTAFSGSENSLNLNDKLDFIMVSAGGTAKRVTVSIEAAVN